MTATWKAYNELAWTENWLADPVAVKDEAAACMALIKKHCIFMEPACDSFTF